MVRFGVAPRRRGFLPSVLAAVAIYTTTTVAQNSDDNGNAVPSGSAPAPSNANNDEDPTPTPENDPAPQSTGGNTNTDANDNPSPSGSEAEESPSTPTPTADEEDDAVITGGEPAAEITPSPTTDAASTDNDAVAITGGEANTISESDFPSLSKNPLFITYPSAAVPPTINAPFMHHSTAPEGTVFIAVGAILGAFGLGILLWRGIVACLLHRSVRRAAMEQHIANDKASFPAPPAQFYKYSDHNSSLSLAAAGTGRGMRRTNRGPIPSAVPSQSNLFFSPTAAGAGAGTANSRDSRFLPSGFYAAGSSSPGPADQTQSIGLTNLRPDAHGGPRGTMYQVTPPDSPRFTARREMSTSTLNLSISPQGGRAPSAYLEDLLDENPQAFPPSQMPPPNPQRQRSPGPRF